MGDDRLRSKYLCAAAGIMLVAACGSQKPNVTQTEKPSAADMPTLLTAEKAAASLLGSGVKISDVVSVTEANDDNHLLGRPGQYTSKVFFYDSRHPKVGEFEEGQSTIEAFANASDAKRRRDYVMEITKDMPMLTQYQFLSGNILIRLDKVLTPAEAKEYSQALAGLKLPPVK